MMRYVATLTTVFLLALAASAQGRPRKAVPAVVSAPANYGPAGGACGPDHPFIQKVIQAPIGDPAPGRAHGLSVAGLTRRSDLVLLGRPTGFSAAPGRYGRIETTATFAYPMVLKSPAGGPSSGVKSVQVNFVGGTALMDGICTEDLAGSVGQTQMHAGGLYLVFAGLDKSGGGFWGGPVYAIDEKTAHVVSPATYARLRKGTADSLVPAIRAINAEVARERRAAEARSGGQQ
ncbi:MAG: hypothetical protein ACRD2F_06245 [Terriglobales bacterium]